MGSIPTGSTIVPHIGRLRDIDETGLFDSIRLKTKLYTLGRVDKNRRVFNHFYQKKNDREAAERGARTC